MINLLPDLVRQLFTTRLSVRAIALRFACSKTTVGRYKTLLADKGQTWDSVKDLSGAQLNALLNCPKRFSGKVHPNWEEFEREMRGPAATVYEIWEDYRESLGASAISYPYCARLYAQRCKARPCVMHQEFEPGYVAQVDYSGKKPYYRNKITGIDVPVELFVGILGSSNYIFVCCTATQSTPDWLDANVRMLEFYGGSPRTITPDNLRAAISKTGAEPVIQKNFQDFARHYGMAILPARPGEPQDKGLVENAVRLVQRRMLHRLARVRYFSLEEVDAAVEKLLPRVNARAFKQRDGNRQSAFALEQSCLTPLPVERFRYRHWVCKQKVPPNYHVAVDHHFYSVSHTLVGCTVQACITLDEVEIHSDGVVVARHQRRSARGGHTTAAAHQPAAHVAMGQRTPEQLTSWAATIGPNMEEVVRWQFQRKIPLEGLNAAVALRNLSQGCSAEELEAAAGRAWALESPTPTTVRRELGRDAIPVGFRKQPLRRTPFHPSTLTGKRAPAPARPGRRPAPAW